MRTSELTADDLAPGVLCTVLASRSVDDAPQNLGQVMVGQLMGGKYNGLIGHALVITAVDLPFVVVEFYGWKNDAGRAIDTREAQLVKVSLEFAKAQCPRPKWWQFWRKVP